MKILIVTQGYAPAVGGTELLIQCVSEELVRQFGDEVTVFTTNCYSGDAFYTPGQRHLPVGWEMINGVHVRRFPVYSHLSRMFYLFRPSLHILPIPGNQYFRNFYNGPIIPGLSNAIREFDSDIVLAASFPLMHMFTALKTAHRTNRPCIFVGCLHPDDIWGFGRPMIYKAIQQAEHYIALTKYEADYVIRRGADPNKVTTTGVGIDLGLFENINPLEAKKRLGAEDAPLVGFIGQLGGHKGVDTLLRAMPLVWRIVPETRLLLAGARTLFASQLEEMINQFPEEDRQKIIIRYNFASEEKPWLFSALDLLAFPSGYESFGITYIEAWAVKKPVIGTRQGAIPWVVDAGRDGLLVPFQHEQILADAILTLIQNPVWAHRLGERGYQKVVEKYNWPQIARIYRKVLYEAAGSNNF